MNYLHIKVHQTWLQAGNEVPKIILHELRPCEESEYWEVRSHYENRKGKYGMNNTSLDICHHITEKMANQLLFGSGEVQSEESEFEKIHQNHFESRLNK